MKERADRRDRKNCRSQMQEAIYGSFRKTLKKLAGSINLPLFIFLQQPIKGPVRNMLDVAIFQETVLVARVYLEQM